MIRLFTGWDEREAVGFHVFAQSVLEHSTLPVEITPITKKMAGGTNAFTRSRFLVPSLCNFEGWAIFADGVDMLCRGDLAELWAFKDVVPERHSIRKDIWCVKHNYKSSFLTKYEGTEMEAANADYDRKNWASLFLVDCASPFARLWHPELIESAPMLHLLQLAAFHDDRIGALPREWNWLVGEYPHSPDAKIAHFTLGIPGFAHYFGVDYADEWRSTLARSQRGLQAQSDAIKAERAKLKASQR